MAGSQPSRTLWCHQVICQTADKQRKNGTRAQVSLEPVQI
jgi:hypothetical protein